MSLLRFPFASLRGRLTFWSGLLSFLVLGALFIGVFFSVKNSQDSKQTERLATSSAAIEHVFSESKAHQQRELLLHDLEDLLVADRDLHIQLITKAGEKHFVSKQSRWPSQSRNIELALEDSSRSDHYSRVVVAIDTSEDTALLERLSAILWGAALIGCVLISVGGTVIVHVGLSPVRMLVEETRHLAASSLEKRLDTKSLPAELAQLVEQFNELLGRLETAYQQLEGFNADVAHELRTPLATLVTNFELALRSHDGEAQLRESIGSGLEDLFRLSGIVTDMLFLSQADRGAKARREIVPSMAQLCRNVISYYESVLDESNLTCSVNGEHAGMYDAPLVQRALSNLLSNAARYAKQGTEIVINIQHDTAGCLRLSVENYGPQISQQDLPNIFDRFFRTDPARTRSGQNHGLGLAIVRAIAKMHDGYAFATSRDGFTEIGLCLNSQS